MGHYSTPSAAAHAKLHRLVTLNRRIEVLSTKIAELLPDTCSVLDVGCGSGEISKKVSTRKAGIQIRGMDVLVRPETAIPVERYDGTTFPFPDDSFDFVLFVDVLHHTPDPLVLLKEAHRVARQAIVIKDHNCNTAYHRRIMCLTDWFGNWQFGVQLLFNFWTSQQWSSAWRAIGAKPDVYLTDFGLYPKFTRIMFARDMDFIARVPVIAA
jgi:SAM-dependent methyltransferase